MSLKEVNLTLKNQEFSFNNNYYKFESPSKILIQGSPLFFIFEPLQ